MIKIYYTLIKDKILSFINFIKNVWLFRKALTDFHWWAYQPLFQFMNTGINEMVNGIENKGSEIKSTKMKKVAKMRRACEILQNHIDDNYTTMAENILGKRYDYELKFIRLEDRPGLFSVEDGLTEEQRDHNHEVFLKSRELEVKEWEEFCEIIKGQGDFFEQDEWEEKFDGSGLKNWWN
jgi:hypothetical protein